MSGNEDSLGGPPTSSTNSPYHSISVSVPPPSSRSSSSNLLTIAPGASLQREMMPGPSVISNDFDLLMRKLQDQNERDDTKLKVLLELWESFDAFTALPQYSNQMDNLLRCFMKLFSETTAQFIAENNTQQLRKLMLEIILRTSGVDTMRNFSKQIQAHMMKIIQSDNELNGVLAIKILIDHLKLNRVQTGSSEQAQVTGLLSFVRKCFNDMEMHVRTGRMFEQRTQNTTRPSGIAGEEQVIETSLQVCFQQHQLNLDTKGSALLFQLIPRASQSVKVFSEIIHLIMLIYQQYKMAINAEILDLTQSFITFINVRVPPEQAQSETRNQELLNEFHNAQVKALGFFSYLIRSTGTTRNPILEALVGSGERIISGTLLLLETCPILVVNQRKELLGATKIFFSFEPLRVKFLPYIPRLFSEKLMIGPAFTANDCLRKMMYEQLADLLHHLRAQLSYPVLCHATYVFSRCLHDPLLPPSMQAMSIRLIMNLCDSFVECEKKNNEPSRDLFFGVLESVISKLRVLVLYHLPLMFAAAGETTVFRGTEFAASEMHPEERQKLVDIIASERRHSNSAVPNPAAVDLDDPSLHCTVEGVPELEPRPSANVPDLSAPTKQPPEKGYSSVDSMLAATWTASGPPMPVQEARHMIRFLIQSCKYIFTALKDTKKTDRALTPAEERDTCARLLKYGLQALDVYMINPQSGMPMRQSHRDDKECIETFAMVFTLMNPDVFNEIFSNYTPFLIERIAVNPSLQIICNTFLVNPETCSRFGSILAQYLLKRMPEMAYSNPRADLYLKLFKLIFSAISCTQSSAQNTAGQNVEKMIKPWLHQIVRDSMYCSLRGREPTNYFLLLRALFRSIGGGSQDVASIYHEFLPLLPSLLSFLNRMQAGQHRMAMRELFVELCLTVPVRLSSLLPHLPLLMDPLVCSLSGAHNVTPSTSTRVSGLRTLELCVDNLQPEYLHEHIAPVRASLIQGLWRVVAKSSDQQSAMLALKILGKFGSTNRKMLSEPQPLASLRAADVDPLFLRVVFERPPQLQLPGAGLMQQQQQQRDTATMSSVEEKVIKMEIDDDRDASPSSHQQTTSTESMREGERMRQERTENGQRERMSVPSGPIVGELCLSDAVKVALDNLRWTSMPDERFNSAGPNQPPPPPPNQEGMRRHAAALCRTILMAAVEERGETIEGNMERVRRRLESMSPDSLRTASIYRSTNEQARRMYVNALMGIAIAVTGKDLRQMHIKFFSAIVRQLTTQALLEQMEPPSDPSSCMDGLIVSDVITMALADPVKHDFGHAAVVMLRIMCDTCYQAARDVPTFCALPLLHQIVARLAELCYASSAVSKLGGTTALAYVVEEFPRMILRKHLEVILRAFVETIVGLAYEVSSGAVEAAVGAIDRLIVTIFVGRDPKGQNTNEKGASSSQAYSSIRMVLPANDEEDVIDEREKIRIRSLMARILVPLLDSADTYTHNIAVRFVSTLSSLSGVSVAELTTDGELSRMCARGLSDFPGLSLWKQLGVLNAVSFATRNGVPFEFPPGTDEQKVLEVYVEQLSRICRESSEKLLTRKTYMLVGASSPTIPHAVSAKFIREAAIRGLCLAYAVLPRRETIEGLQADRILTTVLDALRGREKKEEGLRDAAVEGILEAHKLRPLPDEVIRAELHKLVEAIEQIKELSNVNARLFCCLIKINGVLFDDRCHAALMSILRSWDERTRRSSADLKQQTTSDVEAIDSVLLMLPHIPKKPRVPSGNVKNMTEDEKVESIIKKEEKMEVDEEDDGKGKKTSTIRSLLEARPDPSDFVPVVASLASTMHAAFCISRSTFFSSGALVDFLSAYPIRTLRFFLSSDSLAVMARRSLFKRVFEAEGAAPLRKAAAESPYLMRFMLKLQYLSPSSTNDPWSDTEFNKPLSPYDDKTMDHELLTVWMIDVWSRNDVEAYCKRGSILVKTLQEIWRSDDFKTRYMVKTDEQSSSDYTPIRIQFMNTPKYEVPKLFASCFIRYLRENYDNLDLFTDLLFVFIGSFATDFSFVRNYLTTEVIPTYPLKWRRDLFSYVLSKFEEDKETAVGNLHIARVMQYALTPVLQYAFERFDVEEILGPRTDPSETEPKNLVIRLSDIITSMGKQLSDTMTLAYYHLSSLIVIHAPNYIHVNTRTSHSSRLRIFMLFAWPCLNSSSMDVTLKFMGHLFLCHIIEKFTINRKIVLQVYNSLTGASQQDSRDIVKKALDILTPQLPIRMEDGLVELVKAVRKALCEESHNVSNVFHCLQTVTRNFKTYFSIRHELLPLLLNGISRLLSYQAATGFSDGKRLAVEVCEMVMKWEIMRKQEIDKMNGVPIPMTVEKVLESLKRLEQSKTTSSQSTTTAAGAESVVKTEKEEAGGETMNESDRPPQPSSMPSMEEQMRPMPKEQMDQVVNILFKIATSQQSLPGTPPAHVQAATEMSRRSIALLRAALKPALWGELTSIKIAWLEKQLTITNDQVAALQAVLGHQQREYHAISSHFYTASNTLEVLSQLITVMPKKLALATIHPLQNALKTCIQVQSALLTRAATALVSRLMDNSSTSSCGLDEYESLSQFVGKYINDTFTGYDKNPSASITTVYTAFNLLRAMCQSQPDYLDTVCMQNMMKVLMKAAREFTTMSTDPAREKMISGICDTATLALDLLRPRVGHMTPDQRRQLAGVVILPFCESTHEKLLDMIIKLTRELIVTHTDELTANPGLSIVVKLSHVIRSRFRSKTPAYIELSKMYLQQLVLYIFEHDVLRRTEFAAKLEDAYYWGLTNPLLMMDDSTRTAFLNAFEKHVPSTLPARLMYIFAQHDWTLMRDTFWIKHALFLIIRCAFPADPTKTRHKLNLRETATFGATIDWLIKDGPADEERGDEPMETDEEKHRLSELLNERRNLLAESRSDNLQKEILNHLMGLIWAVQDPSMVRSLFTRLLTSIWTELHPQERHQLQSVLPNFLSSATHMAQANQPVSALSVIMEALSKCQPPIQFAPALVKYVSSRHRTFYLGMLMLEEEASHCESLTERMKEVAGPELPTRFAKQLDALESLNALYTDMNEYDQQCAVWQRRAFMPETVRAVEAMAKGEYVFALNLLEELQIEHLDRLERLVSKHAMEGELGADIKEEEDGELHMAVAVAQYETDAWTRMHQECLMNLGHWADVEELANLPNQADAKVLMRAASHRQDPFLMMRQCKEQLSACLPPDFVLQYHQYSALIAVMDGMGDTVAEFKQVSERATEESFALGVSKWRLLPAAVGVSHLKLLQMAHLTQDLCDAANVTCALHPSNPPFSQPLIVELKGVIKTWRTWSHNNGAFFAQGGTYNCYRSPSLHDDLPVSGDFLNIRKRVFVKLSRVFDDWVAKGQHTQQNPQINMGHLPLPMHSLIHTQILAARSFRSARLYEQAEHALNLIHSESSMPVASVVAKIVEHVKLLREWANDEMTTNEEQKEILLRRALQMTEEVQMDDVCKEFFSRIYAQRGLILSDLRDSDNAYKTFEMAVGMQDPLVLCHAYAAWAKHLDKMFERLRVNEADREQAVSYGVQAIPCYVEGAKIEHDSKARRYIARAIWLSRLVSETGWKEGATPIRDALELPVKLEKAARSCCTNYWIEWLPQLCLDVKKEIGNLGGFVATCARIHPIHTYYAMRQQMSKKSERMAIVEEAARNPQTNCSLLEELDKGEVSKDYFILPKIKDLCRLAAERRPSDILAMERLFTAIDEMKDVWAERHLRTVINLQKELFKCLHENINTLSTRPVVEITKRWRERLEMERRDGLCRNEYVREIDIKRSTDERLNEDEGENEEVQFIHSFSSSVIDFLARNNVSTIELASMTVEWRRALEKRIEELPKTIPLRLCSPFLASFCSQTATIDLPGDLFALKNLQYMSTVSRFGPQYQISLQGDQCVKGISIRSQSGKTSVYFVRKLRRECGSRQTSSRVPQLMRMMDHLVQSDRGTCQRFLKLIPPIVVHCGNSELVEYTNKKECGFFLDEVLLYHLSSVVKVRTDQLVVESEQERRRLMNEGMGEDMARMEVYRSLQSRIPSDLLLKMMQKRVPDATNYYLMRKSLVSEWALLAGLEFALNLSPTLPSSILIDFGTGRSSNPNSRIDLTKGASNEDRMVPFRVSDSLDRYMGFTKDGHFAWALQATLGMMNRRKPEMYLRPIVWDCIAEENDMCRLPIVNERSMEVVKNIMDRVRRVNRANSEEDSFGLLKKARDPSNLSRMPAYWHAWF